MEDQLVTIRTALLAREKGFNTPTYYYSNPQGIFYTPNPVDWNNEETGPWDDLSMPTQKQLQNWLKIYNCLIEIQEYCLSEEKAILGPHYAVFVTQDAAIDKQNPLGYFKIYKQALEYALYIGLNLIDDNTLLHELF